MEDIDRLFRRAQPSMSESKKVRHIMGVVIEESSAGLIRNTPAAHAEFHEEATAMKRALQQRASASRKLIIALMKKDLQKMQVTASPVVRALCPLDDHTTKEIQHEQERPHTDSRKMIFHFLTYWCNREPERCVEDTNRFVADMLGVGETSVFRPKVKNAVAVDNGDFKLSTLDVFLRDKIKQITAQDWRKTIELVINVEAKFRLDTAGSEHIQPLIIVQLDEYDTDESEEGRKLSGTEPLGEA
ncbi:hypothetical protein HPB51_018103 [Rhipicephalus microplus]|uniref:Uncharacterized protein n=1 Tax=Rhipicephalus microplus TaxID=6941 RepID=A0A9J6EIH7_RHIMP|nr:hypothetical protein HPB51_018103 [Rhipicephalus microplus]